MINELIHYLTKLFGGKFHDKSTGWTYYYTGEIKSKFTGICYNIKRYLLLKYYSLQIWYLKRNL